MIRLLLISILLTGAFFRLAANCTAPSLLSVGVVTDSAAVLTWTDVGDAVILDQKRPAHTGMGLGTQAEQAAQGRHAGAIRGGVP